MASIFVVAGRDRGKFFALESESVLVGRDDGCDFQVVDDMVSRRHMALHRQGEGEKAGYVVEDLDSANGVKVNGHRVLRRTSLHDGDSIEIGESKLLYSLHKIRDVDTAMAFLKERGQQGRDTVIR